MLDHEGRICELIDGTLVEKVMGMQEARLTAVLIFFLESFLSRHNLGFVTGPDGTLKLTTGLLRIPDVTFVSWDRLPGRELPDQPVRVGAGCHGESLELTADDPLTTD